MLPEDDCCCVGVKNVPEIAASIFICLNFRHRWQLSCWSRLFLLPSALGHIALSPRSAGKVEEVLYSSLLRGLPVGSCHSAGGPNSTYGTYAPGSPQCCTRPRRSTSRAELPRVRSQAYEVKMWYICAFFVPGIQLPNHAEAAVE